jgi:hypothetical protein
MDTRYRARPAENERGGYVAPAPFLILEMDGSSGTSYHNGSADEPLLQPGAYLALDEVTGEGYQQKEGKQISEKTGGEEKHPSHQYHGPVQELCCGELPKSQFILDVANCLETLGANQPGPCKADGEKEQDRRQGADGLAGLDDEVDLDDRHHGEEDEETDEHWRAFRYSEYLQTGMKW